MPLPSRGPCAQGHAGGEPESLPFSSSASTLTVSLTDVSGVAFAYPGGPVTLSGLPHGWHEMDAAF